MSGLRLYFRFLAVSFRVQMRYKASFVLYTFSNFTVSILELLAVYFLFSRFERLGDWTLYEVMVFYGMTYMAFALAEAYMRGFDTAHRLILSGEFDRILLRPRGAFIQVLGSEFQLLRVGRFINGLIPFVIGVVALKPSWSAGDWALIGFSVISGSLTYAGVMMIRAMACFFTIEGLEVFNIFTHGGVGTNQYPMDIYTGWVKGLFTYVIPLAAMNYWPMSLILDKGYVSPALAIISPLFGPAFFGAGYICWRFGVRHYKSTGS